MDDDIQFLIDKASTDAVDRANKSICEYPGQLGFRIHRMANEIKYVIGYLNVPNPAVGQDIAQKGDFIPLAIRSNTATTETGLDGEVDRVIEFLGSFSERFHIVSENRIYRVASKGIRFQSGRIEDA